MATWAVASPPQGLPHGGLRRTAHRRQLLLPQAGREAAAEVVSPHPIFSVEIWNYTLYLPGGKKGIYRFFDCSIYRFWARCGAERVCKTARGAKVRHGANPDAGIYACCQHYCEYYTIISFGASNARRTGQGDNFYLGDSIYFSFGFFRHIIYGIYMNLFATKRPAPSEGKFILITWGWSQLAGVWYNIRATWRMAASASMHGGVFIPLTKIRSGASKVH